MSITPACPETLISRPSKSIRGRAVLPGDKSISHRAFMFGGLAAGETKVTGMLEADDVLRTGAVMRALGVQMERTGDQAWSIFGRGVEGLSAPREVLDFGNSGTGVRLMMGILAGHPFTCQLTGDHSLCARPMKRVTAPLEDMGAETDFADGTRLPGSFTGGNPLRPIRYEVPVPSAQVKSAVLLAGLHAPGETTVIEAVPTRDHTERMLRRFGAQLKTEDLGNGAVAITVTGQPELKAQPITVPGDPSSAAFPMVAAVIANEGEVILENVLMNPMRTGLITCLEDMGAKIERLSPRESGGEDVADLKVSAPNGLKGIEVPPERAPSMIDEYPALAIAAANAEGTTIMRGLEELRVKESDRLAAMAAGLAACGADVEEGEDHLIVHGRGRGSLQGGATIASQGDHRIAMAFFVAGLAAKTPITLTGADMIATSFPTFLDLMTGLGADFEIGD